MSGWTATPRRGSLCDAVGTFFSFGPAQETDPMITRGRRKGSARLGSAAAWSNLEMLTREGTVTSSLDWLHVAQPRSQVLSASFKPGMMGQTRGAGARASRRLAVRRWPVFSNEERARWARSSQEVADSQVLGFWTLRVLQLDSASRDLPLRGRKSSGSSDQGGVRHGIDMSSPQAAPS